MKSLQELLKTKKIDCPDFLSTNCHYQVVMGSLAYGVSTDVSDVDVYGFCIPPKTVVFPHLAGEILGFGKEKKRFEVWQQHHIKDDDGKNYDFSIYSIVKFFHLCMNNNPNMIDSLFVPQHCILQSTSIGEMVRQNRRLFLHKGAWHAFKGYSYSQLHKLKIKKPEGKRAEMIEKYGYDVKFAYHVVRLLGEVEQILLEGDLTLDRKDRREQMKSIRNGDWTLSQLDDYFTFKEKDLESLYLKSSLPYSANESKIKGLLIDCLEHHYGSIENCVNYNKDNRFENAILEIRNILNKL